MVRCCDTHRQKSRLNIASLFWVMSESGCNDLCAGSSAQNISNTENVGKFVIGVALQQERQLTTLFYLCSPEPCAPHVIIHSTYVCVCVCVCVCFESLTAPHCYLQLYQLQSQGMFISSRLRASCLSCVCSSALTYVCPCV